MKKITLPTLILSIFALYSCGESEKQSNTIEYNYEKSDSLSVEYTKELGSIRVNIEQSAKLFHQMNKKGIAFDKNNMDNLQNSQQSTLQKALGIGIASSCLAYTSQYEQTQLTGEYLVKLYDLATALDVEEAFDNNLIDKLISTDTTINKTTALTKAYMRASDQMYSVDRAQMVSMMVFGGWLEGLSITLAAIGNQTEDTDIRMGIFDMVMASQNTTKVLEVFKDESKDIALLYSKMENLQPSISAILKSKGKLNSEMLLNLKTELAKVKKELL